MKDVGASSPGGPWPYSSQSSMPHDAKPARIRSYSAPLRAPSGSLYAMNVSFPTAEEVSTDAIEAHAQLLLRLAADLRRDWAR